MTQHRITQMAEIISHLAAEYLGNESNRQSMITVTRADIAPNFKRATIYFTVFPRDHEEQALEFVKRQRRDFRDFIKRKAKLKYLPVFSFEIDEGEKSRQRLDEISRDAKK